jgi:hypothetical protein
LCPLYIVLSLLPLPILPLFPCQLGRDVERREEMEADIRLNVDKLWDRRDVVYEWARFLARAVVRTLGVYF